MASTTTNQSWFKRHPRITVAGATAVGLGALAAVDRFTGVEIARPVADFYSNHHIWSAIATLGGAGAIAYAASQTVRDKVKEFVPNLNYSGLLVIGGFSAAIIGSLVWGGFNAHRISSLEAELNSQNAQISNIQLKEGPQGQVGPQGIQGIKGVPGASPSEQDIANAVDAYLKASPLPTQAATPAPKPAPTPAPYAPPQVFSVNYASFKSIVGKDVKGVSQATGIGVETLNDLVDGETGKMARNGVNTYDPELVTVKIDTAADTATFEFKSGSTTSYTVRSAKKLVDYLVEKTPLEKRAEVFQPATK